MGVCSVFFKKLPYNCSVFRNLKKWAALCLENTSTLTSPSIIIRSAYLVSITKAELYNLIGSLVTLA